MTDLTAMSKWRDGDFSDEVPNHDEPRPNKFKYEVEYSTFTDKIFKLPDLTVRGYLRLASRIAKRKAKKGKGKSIQEYNEDFEDFEDDSDDDNNEEEDEVSDLSEHDDDNDDQQPESDFDSTRKGKKKKSKRRKSNKVWKHFLREAFVSTVPEKKLKKWSRK